MSSLAFLHADATLGGPPALSPMARAAAAAGARFETRDGWEVAVGYFDAKAEAHACREKVGLTDMSHLGKLELQGPLDTLGDLDLGCGKAVRHDDAWWCAATPQRGFVVCEAHATAQMRERLAEAFAGHVLDVTASYGALAITGPLARETFARICALDLRPSATPIGGFRPGSFARTPGYVLREAPERYLAIFGAAVGSYVWTVVADAAVHLGGRPVGVDALAAAAPLIDEVEPVA